MRRSIQLTARANATSLVILATAAITACTAQAVRSGSPDAAQVVRSGSPETTVRAAADTLRIPPLQIPYIPLTPTDSEPERGLAFRLMEGSASTAAGQPSAVPPETALSAEVTANLLARLPPLPDTAAAAFRFPAASPPPPRTGAIVTTGFPTDSVIRQPPPVVAPPGALEVVRIVPTGETTLAPHLTITFNQPMVPLTTIAGTEVREPPVRLAPQPPGRWTWLDPRTLRFVPVGRFPMATQYTVEIPAGTRSAAGTSLGAAVRATFATPAPRALGAYPALDPDTLRQRYQGRGYDGFTPLPPSATDLQPIIVIVFDQDVAPERVLAAARLTANGRALPLRLATDAEIAADTVADVLTRDQQPARWIALRPTAPLPRNADVRVVIMPGPLSTEGPRTADVAQELRFRTYGPLDIAAHDCWGRDECPIGAPWTIRFTNPLDTAASEPRLRIEPALPEMSLRMSGTELYIFGQARPNTRYQVTIEGGIVDRFGQTMSSRTVTFTTSAAQPVLALLGAPLIVLDPAGPPRVRLHSQGLASVSVRVYRVSPQQWPAYADAIQRWHQGGSLTPPGQRVSQQVVSIATPDGFSETLIDVGAALDDGLGHAVVTIEPAGSTGSDAGRRQRHAAFAWVQGTRIGVAAAVNGTELLGWATSLETGAPLAGVELRLLPSGSRAVTDANGMAVVELGASSSAALIATQAGDTALVPENEHGHGAGWRRRTGVADLRWLLLSDRGLYQPGETAHVKGWLREMPAGRNADLRLADDITALTYRLRGPRGEDLGTGELRPNALGGFHTAIDLPEALNLGYAQLEIEPRGVSNERRQPGHLGLRVQEFRRPDYAVTLEAEPGPHIVGNVVDLELLASYYGGGGLGGAQVEWRVTPGPAAYHPPGWDRWQFGRSMMWWLPQPAGGRAQTLTGTTDAGGSHRVRVELEAVDPPFAASLRAEAQVQDVTRQVGSAATTLLVHPAALNVGLRVQRSWVARGEPLTVDMVVVDHDGRTVPGRRVQLVRERVTWTWSHVRAPQIEVQDTAVVCDVSSAADPTSCTITLAESGMHRLRADVRDDAGRISRTEVIVWVPGGSPPPRMDPGRFEMTPDRTEYQPGDTARVMIDAPFFPAEGLLTLRRAGIVATERFRVTGATHELRIPITEQHISGVSARVELIDAERPTRSASGQTLLTVPPHTRALDVTITPRDSVVAPGAETVIDVHVQDANGRAAANAEVALWMVDEAVLAIGGYALPDPLAAFYPPRGGSDVRDHALRAWLRPWPRSAGPGTVSGTVLTNATGGAIPGVTVRLEGTDITAVTSFDGTFVLRNVAPGDYVLIVDTGDGSGRRVRITVPAEGVNIGNMVAVPGGGMGDAVELQALVVTGAEGRAAMAPVAVAPPPPPPPAPGAAAQGVDVRSDFSALAVFEPSLRTDAAGRVQVRVRLPANLTRYRVMAVAVSGARHFGTGEAAVTANKPLMARITAPRFLNYGDRFELPVLVQNASAERLEIDVAARAAGLRITDAQGRRVVLPPGGRTEVRFAATALRPGSAQVQVITVAGAHTDAALIGIPIYTPATTEAFALYGVVDTNAPVVIPVSRPRDVIPQFGGAEISITSTALHSLTDAVLYLHTYPFYGAEHLSSRILAVAALRDVLTAFAAEQLPSREELVAQTQRDIAHLAGLQNGDGGWGFWFPGEESNPFVSVHAAHALERARAEGFDVAPATLRAATEYMRRIDDIIAAWPLRARQSMRAYALYVRHRLDDGTATAEARRMAAAPADRVGGELPVEAAAWLLHILADDPNAAAQSAELRRLLMNRVEETAGGASFTADYEDGAYLLLHSRRRTDAVVLDALIAADPDSDLIPKLASSLLAHRVRGRWAGTQENAWVLLALNSYFRTYEATTPNFESRVWLGERFAGAHTFSGRTTERQHVSIPMPELLRADTATLLVARAGEGRMYYRAGLRYAPTDLRPDALERGFSVSRVYEAVDDDGDVQRNEDGSWTIRAGARVRVRVNMVAPSARTHVALVDPLPAGLEPLNPELQGTGIMDDPGRMPPPPPPPPGTPRAPRPPVRSSWWFVHQNLRDDRAEAFATLLPAGVYEYTYLARATTPGTFVVPPPRAEMMYEPETFGRGSGDTVVIRP